MRIVLVLINRLKSTLRWLWVNVCIIDNHSTINGCLLSACIMFDIVPGFEDIMGRKTLSLFPKDLQSTGNTR